VTKTSYYLRAGMLTLVVLLLSRSIVAALEEETLPGSSSMAEAAATPATQPASFVPMGTPPTAAAPMPTASVPATPATNGALLPLRGQTEVNRPLGGNAQTFRRDPLLELPSEPEESPHALHFLPDDAIWLRASSSQIFDFRYRLKRVSIANSKIADIQVINPYQLNLIGHNTGFTTLTVWDQQGHYEQRQVRVDVGGKQQVLLKCIVAQLDRSKMENQGINLAIALQNTGLSLVSMPGTVATPFSPSTQTQVITPGGGIQTVNVGATLPPAGTLIPMLLSQNLTYGVATSIGQFNSATFIQLLENHNLAKVLAEPDLLTTSGEKAQFLAGGEIPIVVAQALNSSIVFKQYGTKVTFLPNVVGRDDIEMLVEPEVSEPDYAHEVQLNGFTVPAFLTRSARTMVRLKNRQTLIIAGLNLNEQHSVVEKVPYLGDIPYAGALFRTTSYENDSSDLVMVVTPELVGPLPEGGQAYLPTSRRPLTASDIETRRLAIPDVSRPRF
jgi:Flp pilus assembly secretin CpaC